MKERGERAWRQKWTWWGTGLGDLEGQTEPWWEVTLADALIQVASPQEQQTYTWVCQTECILARKNWVLNFQETC